MAGRRKIRIKGRFYVIVAAFLALLIWAISGLVRLIHPTTIDWGRLETDKGAQALIIRNEEILTYQEYAKLDPVAAEGAAVTVGQEVATLYTTGYSPKDVSNLMTLQQTIKDYQTNNILKSVVDQDLSALETEITNLLTEISRVMDAGELDRLLTLEQQLCDTMERRRVYMNTSIQTDSHLETLYQQEATLQNRIDANKVTVLSPINGVLSYLIDGYETMLRPDMLGECTPSSVENILRDLDTTGVASSRESANQGNEPVFRVVQESPWYLLMVLPKADITLTAGSECEVTVEGYPSATNAYVVDVRTEKGKALVILEIKDPIASLLSLRRVSVHIGRSVEGYRVPRDMVGVDENGAYIVVKGPDGDRMQVRVAALGEDAGSAIVTSIEEGKILTVGMRLYAP